MGSISLRRCVAYGSSSHSASPVAHSIIPASRLVPPAPLLVLVRKCALQSTSMPAFHRRNVPNCKPMVDGGMRKCSAGACPPLGSGWGVAESTVPIRCTKPQLRLFIPWCAGGNRHGRLVRKHVPDSDQGSIPAPAGDTNHRRPNNDSPGSQERNVARGLVPRWGRGGA